VFLALARAWWPASFRGLGVAALLHAFWRFVVEGLGTPAPVAPTEHLVVGGLYRYVRNPCTSRSLRSRRIGAPSGAGGRDAARRVSSEQPAS